MAVGEIITWAREYTYELTKEDLLTIERRDGEQESYDDTLVVQLSNLVRDVDYDSDFGALIYFTIEDINDCERVRDEIRCMITDYIRGAE